MTMRINLDKVSFDSSDENTFPQSIWVISGSAQMAEISRPNWCNMGNPRKEEKCKKITSYDNSRNMDKIWVWSHYHASAVLRRMINIMNIIIRDDHCEEYEDSVMVQGDADNQDENFHQQAQSPART